MAIDLLFQYKIKEKNPAGQQLTRVRPPLRWKRQVTAM